MIFILGVAFFLDRRDAFEEDEIPLSAEDEARFAADLAVLSSETAEQEDIALHTEMLFSVDVKTRRAVELRVKPGALLLTNLSERGRPLLFFYCFRNQAVVSLSCTVFYVGCPPFISFRIRLAPQRCGGCRHHHG